MRRFAILVVLLAGCSSDEQRPRPQPWVTHHDSAHAFTISLPPAWRVAGESLTPGLTDPHEILSAATFRATAGESGNCGHVPAGAVAGMGADDVLLTIQERRGSGGFTERPRPFVLGPPAHGDLSECAERPDVQERSTAFRDAGRAFHVLVATGAAAPASVKADVERALDSLKLEPPWRDRRIGLRLQPPSGWRVKAAHGQVALGSEDDFPVPDGQACIFPSGARRLAPGGAFAFLFEYEGLNRTQRMRFPAFPRFSLRARDRRAYECFGESWLFRWRDGGRAFQVHAYLGERASEQRRRELLAALRSVVSLRR